MTSDSDDLIIYPVPSLIAVLLNRERAKGEPLTQAEVLGIRDNCQAIAMTRDAALRMDAERGYFDIDPGNCWEEWQRARREFFDD